MDLELIGNTSHLLERNIRNPSFFSQEKAYDRTLFMFGIENRTHRMLAMEKDTSWVRKLSGSRWEFLLAKVKVEPSGHWYSAASWDCLVRQLELAWA